MKACCAWPGPGVPSWGGWLGANARVLTDPPLPHPPSARPQVTQQAASGELGPGAVLEGGDTDTERRCAFLELALALAGGLDAAGLETLYKAAAPGMQVRQGPAWGRGVHGQQPSALCGKA